MDDAISWGASSFGYEYNEQSWTPASYRCLALSLIKDIALIIIHIPVIIGNNREGVEEKENWRLRTRGEPQKTDKGSTVPRVIHF